MRNIFLAGLVSFLILGCSEINDIEQIGHRNIDGEFAFPVINAEIGVSDFVGDETSRASILMENDGRLTAVYSGDVAMRTAFEIIPPIPGIRDVEIPDTNTLLSLPVPISIRTKKAVFGNTNVFFNFSNTINESVEIQLTIPNLKTNGVSFQQSFFMPEGEMEYKSELFSVEGWELFDDINAVRIIYNAITTSGERIKLDRAAIQVDVLRFAYVEGFFGKRVFDIEGDIISVGLFDRWKSGGISIEDPRVIITVKNSFGFPVRSELNRLEIETVDNQTIPITNNQLEKGIDFNFPDPSEIGQEKITQFSLVRENSNIHEAFNNRPVAVEYDIDAISFPENDTSEIGFVTDTSFFNVAVSVYLPMYGNPEDLILEDHYDFNAASYESIKSIEFKLLSINEFPVDIGMDIFFLNAQGEVLDSLSSDQSLLLPAATLVSELQTQAAKEQTQIFTFEDSRVDQLRTTQKLRLEIRILNPEDQQGPLWITNEYKVRLKMGAILRINK